MRGDEDLGLPGLAIPREGVTVRLLEAVVGRTTDLSPSFGSQSLSLVWILKCFKISRKQKVLSTAHDKWTTSGSRGVKRRRLGKNVLVGSMGEPGVPGLSSNSTVRTCLLTNIALRAFPKIGLLAKEKHV